MTPERRRMAWQNLKHSGCPYCNAALIARSDGMIRCTECRFVIERERFQQIRENRGRAGETVIRIRWQYLREGKCPLCSEDLMNAVGPHEVLKCLKAECTFRIREDRMQDILADRDHPANRYPLFT